MFSNVITLLFYFFLSHFPSSTILTSARIAAVQIDDEDVLSIVLCKVSFAGYPLLLFLLVRIRDIRFGTCFFGTSCGVVLFPLLPLPGFRGVAVGLVLNSASTRLFLFCLVFVYHLTVIDCLIFLSYYLPPLGQVCIWILSTYLSSPFPDESYSVSGKSSSSWIIHLGLHGRVHYSLLITPFFLWRNQSLR